MKAQFYIQLVYRATLPFTITSKKPDFEPILTPIKVYFKTKNGSSLTFLLISFLLQTSKLKKNHYCPGCPNSLNSKIHALKCGWLIDQMYIKLEKAAVTYLPF